MNSAEIKEHVLETATARSCHTQLLGIQEELHACITETEHDFLEIGQFLTDISQQSKTLIQGAHIISDTLSSSETMTEIERFLTDIDAQVHTQQKQNATWEQAISTIAHHFNSLKTPLKALSKIASRLEVLGMTSKIEDAKCSTDRTDFTFLTKKIDQLSTQSDSKLKEIHRLRVVIDTDLRASIEEMDRLSKVGVKGFEKITVRIEEIMTCMKLQQVKALDASTNTKNGTEQFIADTGACVASLQFQDITRQQIEHVIEALDEIKNLFDQDELSDSNLISIIKNTLLQYHQLDFSRAELKTAIDKLLNSLSEFENSSKSIDQSVLTLLNRNEDSSEDYLLQMKSAFEMIKSQSRHGDQLVIQLRNRMQSTLQTLNEMTSHLGVIDEIGNEIHLIALNAQITAFHYGDTGRTLSVIAEAIQELSNQAKSSITSLSTDLEAIKETSSTLSFNTSNEKETAEGKYIILDTILDRFQDQDDAITKPAASLHENCLSIIGLIHSSHSTLNSHGSLQLLKHSIDSLKEIETLIRSFIPADSQVDVQGEMEAFIETYTMESERRVHQMVVQGEPLQSESSSSESDEDDWDNIELF